MNHENHCVRIIPARAGFTCHWDQYPLPSMDHPRSRGVYVVDHPKHSVCRGSSPLARGLRHSHGQFLERIRIIPARAGFTEAHHSRRLSRADHPRSRGVYPSLLSQYCFARGSSPLARGLLHFRITAALTAGIIPARAGFTCISTFAPPSLRDHPRSRGVYLPRSRGVPTHWGSSPLARGLLP